MVNEKDQAEISKELSLLAKASMIVFIGIFLSKILTYAYKIIIARYYGPEVYGLFSLSLMVFGLFVAFASLGFADGLLRFIPLYRAKKDSKRISFLIKISRKVLLFSGIIAGVALFLASEFIAINIFGEPSLIIFLKLFALLVPIQIFSNVYLSIIKAHERITAFSFAYNVFQNLMKLVAILILILFVSKATYSVALSYLLGTVSVLIFSYLFCKIKLPLLVLGKPLSKEAERQTLQSFLSYSWPLVLSGIIGSVLYWVDTFAIGFFEDAYLVGVYNAAIPIAALIVFSGELFMNLFFPMVTRELAQKNITIAKELSKQVSKWIMIINLPFLVLVLLFPGFFINLIWGAEYLLAKNALRFLAVGMFASSFAAVSSSLLSSKGKSKILLLDLIGVSILNLILNFILVPKYGIDGAAVATMTSLIIWSILIISQAFIYTSILPIRRKMFGVGVSLFISAILLTYLRSQVGVSTITILLLGSLFLLTYLLLIFLTRSFDENDWKILKAILKKIRRKK